MGFDGLVGVAKDFFFVEPEQVERNLVGIGLDRLDEELNLEGNLELMHELEGESELALRNEDLDNLVLLDKLFMLFQEIQNLVV